MRRRHRGQHHHRRPRRRPPPAAPQPPQDSGGAGGRRRHAPCGARAASPSSGGSLLGSSRPLAARCATSGRAIRLRPVPLRHVERVVLRVRERNRSAASGWGKIAPLALVAARGSGGAAHIKLVPVHVVRGQGLQYFGDPGGVGSDDRLLELPCARRLGDSIASGQGPPSVGPGVGRWWREERQREEGESPARGEILVERNAAIVGQFSRSFPRAGAK